MAHKFFYSWQSERPSGVCRQFIRRALERTSEILNQSGIDERVEIDSDTQDVPGTPEILTTILQKIEQGTLFVADLTMCSETATEDGRRLSPNSNVMLEYGYALKAKGRERIICVMNAFYGGSNPADLPFDLRHARAPIRFSLAPDSNTVERAKVFEGLCHDLHNAAKLIIDNIPDAVVALPKITFDGPHFEPGDEVTPEGDYGEQNPTIFGKSPGYVYLRAGPLAPLSLSVAQVRQYEQASAGLEISNGPSGGSFGTNKWGRVSYALEPEAPRRITRDYVQYFRTGDIEIVNGSYFCAIESNAVHVGYLAQKVQMLLEIAANWFEKNGQASWLVEVGVLGMEKRRITTMNLGSGPMIHQPKVSIQKKVDKDSSHLVAEELRIALLAEAGIEHTALN